jgi:short-subunit dehydrogenase
LKLEKTDIKVIGVYPGGIKTHLFDVEPQAPKDFDLFLAPETVAEKVIANLEREVPEVEQIIKRPGQ